MGIQTELVRQLSTGPGWPGSRMWAQWVRLILDLFFQAYAHLDLVNDNIIQI